MNRAYRVVLPIGVVLITLIVFLAFFGWTRHDSPESVAKASDDSYAVWIALLKGFSGDVVYVGSDEAHAYFRIGRFLGAYYKSARVCRSSSGDVPGRPR